MNSDGSDGLLAGAPAGNQGAWTRTSGCPTSSPGNVKCLYPKLQLVQIGNVCYALNQSCLQIYQMLQQSGRSQLMQVDVVPLSKVSFHGGCLLLVKCTLNLRKCSNRSLNDVLNLKWALVMWRCSELSWPSVCRYIPLLLIQLPANRHAPASVLE